MTMSVIIGSTRQGRFSEKPAQWILQKVRKSNGSAMGARGVQQLRDKAIELQMAPIRSSVHIPAATLWAHFQGGDVEKGLAELEKQANVMIDDLLWWTGALKTARQH